MRIIEISEDKFEKMGELTEKMLKYGGRLMSCISELGDQYGISFRDHEGGMHREHDGYGRYGHPHEGMGERYPYMGRGHINYRDDEDDEEMRERRRRDSRGRYM